MLLICPKNLLILIWTRNDEETLSLLGKLPAGTCRTLLRKLRTLGASSIAVRVSAAHSHHYNTRHNDAWPYQTFFFPFAPTVWQDDNDMRIVEVVYDNYALIHTIKTKTSGVQILNNLYSKSAVRYTVAVSLDSGFFMIC